MMRSFAYSCRARSDQRDSAHSTTVASRSDTNSSALSVIRLAATIHGLPAAAQTSEFPGKGDGVSMRGLSGPSVSSVPVSGKPAGSKSSVRSCSTGASVVVRRKISPSRTKFEWS